MAMATSMAPMGMLGVCLNGPEVAASPDARRP